jgi:hypothetical protein
MIMLALEFVRRNPSTYRFCCVFVKFFSIMYCEQRILISKRGTFSTSSTWAVSHICFELWLLLSSFIYKNGVVFLRCWYYLCRPLILFVIILLIENNPQHHRRRSDKAAVVTAPFPQSSASHLRHRRHSLTLPPPVPNIDTDRRLWTAWVIMFSRTAVISVNITKHDILCRN